MRRALMLMMVLLLTTGFKWGSGDKAEKAEVAKATPKTSAYAAPVTKAAVSPTKTADGDNTPSVTATLQAQDPATLKRRIESLARIGRALKALNETKTGGTTATAKAG